MLITLLEMYMYRACIETHVEIADKSQFYGISRFYLRDPVIKTSSTKQS